MVCVPSVSCITDVFLHRFSHMGLNVFKSQTVAICRNVANYIFTKVQNNLYYCRFDTVYGHFITL